LILDPLSPQERICALLVDSINNGRKAKIQQFLDSYLSKRALEEKPLQDHLSLLQKVHDQSGGVDVMKVERPEPNPFVIRVKSRSGEHWARVFLFLDKIEANRIATFGFIPLLDPSGYEELPWSEKSSRGADGSVEIEKHVKRAGEKDIFSGVVLVSAKNKTMTSMAVGFANQSFNIPNRIDTKFNIGSIDKMFTSLSIAQLAHSGKLSLQDKLADFLPNYPNRHAAERITVYHLLTHSAGLGNLFERPKYDNRKKYGISSDFLPVFADEPLLFEPGSKSSYSNEGYIVLGAIIEELSGENYHDYVRKHIHDPAGMIETGPYALDETVPNVATGYMRYEDDPFGLEPRHPNHMFLGWRGNACGGGYSTAPDLLRFATTLRSYKLVTKNLTDEFTTPHGQMRNYGLGFEVETINGKRVIGHTGGGPNSGINCALKIFWDEPYTVIVMGNYDAPAAQDLASDISNFLAA